MAKNALETVGDGFALYYGNTGTLTNGTLTNGTLSGVLGGAVVAVGTMSAFTGIIDITPNTVSVKSVDTTKLASSAAQSQPGTPDYGQVDVTITYDATQNAVINGWIANKTSQFYKATIDDYSTDSSYAFFGYVLNWTPIGTAGNKDETLKGKLTLKIDGVPLFTSGS